jgi:hypothetical protein
MKPDPTEIQLAVQELRELMEPGEIKRLAKKHGMDLKRAYRVLRGERKIIDADHNFIMACYEKALPRKVNRFDKLKNLSNNPGYSKVYISNGN